MIKMRDRRKNIAIFIILIFVFTLFFVSLKRLFSEQEVRAEELSDKLIRFHVLANSDTDEDQELKVKVKNDVIEYMYKKLENSKSLEESRKIITGELNNIKEIAVERIESEGYSYPVETVLEREMFPEKRYGDVVLPPGEYEAVRVLIGEAEGHNWWCVMFPPLCFVDVTMEEFSVDDTQEILKDYLDEEDVEKMIDEDVEVEFKFKFMEMFK